MTDWAELVRRGVESDVLDYKSALDWNELPRAGKAKLVRHVLALANTRGGDVVIGVGEDASGHPSDYMGLTEKQAASFDPSIVVTFINGHVEPPIDVTVERPLVDGKRFAVLHVRPFTTLPHVCANGVENELQTGVFYIRTVEAASRAACRATELQDLIRRALRNQREMLGKMLRGLLYETRQTGEQEGSAPYADEAQYLREYFMKRRKPRAKKDVLLALQFAPTHLPGKMFDLSVLRHALRRAAERTEGVAVAELDAAYFTNTAWRSMPEGALRMWQLGRDAMFVEFAYLELGEKGLDGDALDGIIAERIRLLGALCAELGMEEALFTFDLRLFGTEGARLQYGKREEHSGICHIAEVVVNLNRSGADWLLAPEEHTARILRSLGERFNLPE